MTSDEKAKQITKAQVEAAVTAAMDELEQTQVWIKKSALIERAYLMGLYYGLNAIADEDDLGDLVRNTVMRTMWNRSLDNTFPNTTVGQKFFDLEQSFNDQPGAAAAAFASFLEAVYNQGESFNRYCQVNQP